MRRVVVVEGRTEIIITAIYAVILGSLSEKNKENGAPDATLTRHRPHTRRSYPALKNVHAEDLCINFLLAIVKIEEGGGELQKCEC